jgi:peptidyl-prolyl cis-trans isomerase SurA
MIKNPCGYGRLLAAAILVLGGLVLAPPVAVAQVVVMVNGQPITELDIKQRARLMQLSTQKNPPRQEVLNELINEQLKIIEAKRFKFEIDRAQVDRAFSGMASRMRMNADQFSAFLDRSGVGASTLKTRIKADLTWQQLVRGRFQESLQVGEKDILANLATSASEAAIGYDYTLRPILFVVPAGATGPQYDAKRREAEALRARFLNCKDGIGFARALREVAIRDEVVRNSAELPGPVRKTLAETEVGRLTPPEITKNGVEVFAVCAKKQTTAITPQKQQAREKVFAKRFEEKSESYLKDIRQRAMIEYRQGK